MYFVIESCTVDRSVVGHLGRKEKMITSIPNRRVNAGMCFPVGMNSFSPNRLNRNETTESLRTWDKNGRNEKEIPKRTQHLVDLNLPVTTHEE